MRIISGKHKGLKLISPKGEGTRPTTDRVKENIFNSIENLQAIKKLTSWEHIKVLDCFCGSGALGIETVSRGAKHATFIDENKEAISACKKNLEKIYDTKINLEIKNSHIFKIIENYTKESYSLVFLDPPYDKNICYETLQKLKENNWINTKSLCILETDRKNKESIPAEFFIIKEKNYGRTNVKFIKLKEI